MERAALELSQLTEQYAGDPPVQQAIVDALYDMSAVASIDADEAQLIIAGARKAAANTTNPSQQKAKGNSGPQADDVAPPDGLGECDAGDDTEPPPPRGWLLANTFSRKFISSLLADGGVGKTALRYVQYLSLVTGRSLTGEHVFQRARVLIISLEDDVEEVRRRIMAARLHHNISLSDVKGWLFYCAPGARVGKLMTTDRSGAHRGRLAEYIEAVVIKRDIDLVAIDPFVKSHGVPENENSIIDDVMQILADLGNKHNIAIDVPHHISKGGTPEPGNANRGRGATAMVDAGRLISTLTTMSSEEAQTFGIAETERKQYIRIDSGKVNITKGGGAPKWFHLIGVRLGNTTELYPNGDEVQTVEQWKPPEMWTDLSIELLNQILTKIDAGLSDGNRYSDAPRTADERAVWKVVTGLAPAKTEGQAREMIKTWVKNGVLVKRDYENPKTRKTVVGLYVDHEKRPS